MLHALRHLYLPDALTSDLCGSVALRLCPPSFSDLCGSEALTSVFMLISIVVFCTLL
jgi:hypothetical protein